MGSLENLEDTSHQAANHSDRSHQPRPAWPRRFRGTPSPLTYKTIRLVFHLQAGCRTGAGKCNDGAKAEQILLAAMKKLLGAE